MWTSIAPTQSGYYWVRKLSGINGMPEEFLDPEPQVVEVVIGGDPEVMYIGIEWGEALCAIKGEWYGPISPPD